MRDRQTCVGCGKQSPETETNYTLISAQFGWRLTRYKSPEGSLVVEWRCPTCWREYKRARTIKPGESNPPPPASDDGLPLRMRTPPMPKMPTPMGAFRPRAPSTPGDEGRRSSTPDASQPHDRRPSSPQRASPAPQRPSPAPNPLPARGTPPRPSQSPPRPSQPPAAGPFAPGGTSRPGRGSR